MTKARLMHKVTAVVLHSLLIEAYNTVDPENNQTIETWVLQISSKSPTFKFWLTVLYLEIILLNFVKSIRSCDYVLYKESLKDMIPWYFSFDHTNYARWVAIHIKNLEELEEKVPSVHQEFCNGNNDWFIIKVKYVVWLIQFLFQVTLLLTNLANHSLVWA